MSADLSAMETRDSPWQLEYKSHRRCDRAMINECIEFSRMSDTRTQSATPAGRTLYACKNKTGTKRGGGEGWRVFLKQFSRTCPLPGATTFQINQICSEASEAEQAKPAWMARDVQGGVETPRRSSHAELSTYPVHPKLETR